MNLWQIRHIPNSSQNLVKLTLAVSLGLMAMFCWGFGVRQVLGQAESKSKSAKTATPDPATIAAATDLMKQVHESLYSHSSIKADIEHSVTIGNQQFLASGHYVSSGPKLRLEYTIKPNQGISGGLLEVCDGKELWSMAKVLENKRVTHRDVQQIKAAISQTRTVTDAVLTAELGMGGLAGLVASLERTMKFDAIKEETNDEKATVIVVGRWKPEIRRGWVKKETDPLPVYVPDLVRISVDQQTKFPVRIIYLKQVIEKDKTVNRPLVSLKFSNVEFDAMIADQEFTFEPGEGVVPEDITRQYLDRIKKNADDAAAAGASPAPAK